MFTSRWRTLLLSICSPVHLWNAPPGLQPYLTEEGPESIRASTNQTRLSKPHPTGRLLSNKQACWPGWRFSWRAKPINEQLSGTLVIQRTQHVHLGLVWCGRVLIFCLWSVIIRDRKDGLVFAGVVGSQGLKSVKNDMKQSQFVNCCGSNAMFSFLKWYWYILAFISQSQYR